MSSPPVEEDEFLSSDEEENDRSEELYLSVESNNTNRTLHILSEDGDMCDYEFKLSNWSMMHWASYHGNEKVVDALLSSNAHASYKTRKLRSMKKTNNGRPLTPVSSSSSSSESIQVFYSGTPLHRAAQRGHLSVSWLLLLFSYSPDDVDEIGNSPLHLASANGHDKIVSCFINHGANVWIPNQFQMRPIDVASTSSCRKILNLAMAEREIMNCYEDEHVLERREKMRRKNVENYTMCQDNIMEFIEGHKSANRVASHIQELQVAIDKACEMGVVTETIELGVRRKKWLELEQKLIKDINKVREMSPILTSELFQYVEILQVTLKGIEEFLRSSDQGDPAVLCLDSLKVQANEVSTVSRVELELQNNIDMANSCTTENIGSSIEQLLMAITNSRNVNESMDKLVRTTKHLCDESLIEKAITLHKRLTSELELQEVCDAIEEKSKTRGEDEEEQEYEIGSIEQTAEYPFPPEDNNGEYIWIPSKTLTLLKESIDRLKQKLSHARECEARSSLLEESNILLKKKIKECKAMQSKDMADREAAVLEAQKLVKKKKKKGKKKK